MKQIALAEATMMDGHVGKGGKRGMLDHSQNQNQNQNYFLGAWWCMMSAVPLLGRLKQEDQEFQVIHSYLVSSRKVWTE